MTAPAKLHPDTKVADRWRKREQRRKPVQLAPGTPCPSCIDAYERGVIRAEAIQPLAGNGRDPMGLDRKPQCQDCAAAGTVLRFKLTPDWDMARTAVGNDRQEQYRLPGVPLGLIAAGFMRPNKEGDWEKHIDWLRENGYDPHEES